MKPKQPIQKIRYFLIFFIFALSISGLTAIPLEWEVSLLNDIFAKNANFLTAKFPTLSYWVGLVNKGLNETFDNYPFIAYGTDWLAFGHFVIAIFFIGPLKDPIKNIWVIEVGMIASLLVIPWAFIFGAVRGIPLFWRLIDCSFGILGLVPLYVARKLTINLSSEYTAG